jgi:antitoxin FitA
MLYPVVHSTNFIHRFASIAPSALAAGKTSFVAVAIHSVLTLLYPGFMGSLLQIRDVPDELRRVLKARAAARGQSLNSFLLEVLSRELSRPSVAEVLDRAAARAEQSTGSAAEDIREAREERDREMDGWLT